MKSSQSSDIARLADQLERSFRGGAWHGPSVTEALAEVTRDEAARRPIPSAHTIAEIVGHVTTWIDVARCRIACEPVDRITPERDFPPDPAGSEEVWQATLADLEEAHKKLHALVLALGEEQLDEPVPGSDPTVRGLILGVLQHNIYHAGQIVLLRKAQESLAVGETAGTA